MRLQTPHFSMLIAALAIMGLAAACSDGAEVDPADAAAGSSSAGNGSSTPQGGLSGEGGQSEGAGGQSAGCETDGQCAPQICQNHACVAAECAEDDECSGEDVCTQGRCQAKDCTAEVTFTYTPPEGTDPTIVFLAGSFNDWSPNVTELEADENGVYAVTIELAAGTYQYKFVVDGTWVYDEANPRIVDDTLGGWNSELIMGCNGAIPPECVEDDDCVGSDICEELACLPAECAEHDDCDSEPYCVNHRCSDIPCQPATTFVFTPSGAQPDSVHLAGDFNGWSMTAIPLIKQDSGDWTVTVNTLAPDQSYEYKFVVWDGENDAAWLFDTNNLRTNGSNSLALVSCEGLVLPECVEDAGCTEQICEEYACVAPECTEASPCSGEDEDCIGGRCVAGCVPQATFVYDPPGADPSAVYLAGQFNGWSDSAEPLAKQLDGTWSVTLDTLEDGQSYEYKFVVDGNWVMDNVNLRDNGNNSVAKVSCDGIVPPDCEIDVDCGSADLACRVGDCVPVCEHLFAYAGDATNVVVAGQFNGWSDAESPLVEVATDSWELGVPLAEGAYEYKLVVDGSWILDPENPDQQNTNSLLNHSCSGSGEGGAGGASGAGGAGGAN
jgi:hypothetical protein